MKCRSVDTKIEKEKFEMSPADVSAVIDHIYTHARGNQNGRPWSIYCRMLDFLNNEPPSPDQNGPAAVETQMPARNGESTDTRGQR